MKPAHDLALGKIFDEDWRAEAKTVNDDLMTGVLRAGKPAGDITKPPTKGA
jgi:hypothetical protein